MTPPKRVVILLGLSLVATLGLSARLGAAPTPSATEAPPIIEGPGTTPAPPAADPEPRVSLGRAQQLHEAGKHPRAFAIYQRLLDKHPNDADVFLQRGLWYYQLQRHPEAIADLRRVTELAPDFAGGWGSLGGVLLMHGDFAAAQRVTQQAQALDPAELAWTLNLGHSHLLQGDRETAHQWYVKAIPLIPDADRLRQSLLASFDLFIQRGWQVKAARAERDWAEAAVLAAIADNQRALEQQRLADQWFAEAQRLRAAHDPLAAAAAYEGAAAAERASGRPRQQLAAAVTAAASIYLQEARYAQAEPLLAQALRIAQGQGYPELLWNAFGTLADLYAVQAEGPLAIFYGKQAINYLEGSRQRLDSGSWEPTSRRAFRIARESAYRGLAERLIDQGRLAEAQQVLQRFLEPASDDLIRTAGARDARQVLIGLNDFEQAQQARLTEAGATLTSGGAELQAMRQAPATTPPKQVQGQAAELEARLGAADLAFAEALTAIRAAFSDASQALTERPGTSSDRHLAETDWHQVELLPAHAQGTDPGTGLVQYLVMPDHLKILLTLTDRVLAVRVPVSEAELTRTIRTLRDGDDSSAAPGHRGSQPPGQWLYGQLIAPIVAAVEASGVRQLMVYLEGPLGYLPLASLHDGERYLIERYSLAVYTAIQE